MLKIFNVRTMGLEESIIAGGYPMREDEIGEWNEEDLKLTERDFKRATKLGNVPTGTGHDNFSKGIIVQYDIRYPQYWSMQMQRYSFHDIVSSNSKMHRLVKMDIDKCCNKYVSKEITKVLKGYIEEYNSIMASKESIIKRDGAIKYKEDLYKAYMRVISNCPMGFEQTMRMTSSFLQLKTIYHQRKTHKLKEDWYSFCAWCESIPNFVDICLDGIRQFTDKDGKVLDTKFDWKID